MARIRKKTSHHKSNKSSPYDLSTIFQAFWKDMIACSSILMPFWLSLTYVKTKCNILFWIVDVITSVVIAD